MSDICIEVFRSDFFQFSLSSLFSLEPFNSLSTLFPTFFLPNLAFTQPDDACVFCVEWHLVDTYVDSKMPMKIFVSAISDLDITIVKEAS